MPLENIDCPLLGEIECNLVTPLLTLANVPVYNIFENNGGTAVGKQSNDGTITRLWRSDNISSFTLLYTQIGGAFNPIFTVTNGFAWRVSDLNDNGVNYDIAESRIIAVPENSGVILDPAPFGIANLTINPLVPSVGAGSYIFDLDSNPIIPGDTGQSILLRETLTTNFAFLRWDFATFDAIPVSAFTAVDVDELAITDAVQSYTDQEFSYIFYPFYNPLDNNWLYPRIKKCVPGPFGGAPLFDTTFQLRMSEDTDREQASQGKQMPCQGTGMFAVSGAWAVAPISGPFYLYAFKYDGSGYYRLKLSGDAQLMMDLQSDLNCMFIVHMDGVYCFQDVNNLGTTLNIYAFPFPVIQDIPIYQPVRLPCHPNCVPLFDRRK